MMNVQEVRKTMPSKSLLEEENERMLDFMIPKDLPGRHQILMKLKDVTIQVEEVVVKPIVKIPSLIRGVCNFFSPDGIWNGNFIAYGTNLFGNPVLLWDDYSVEDINHYNDMVSTYFIKSRMKCDEPVVIVTALPNKDKVTLVINYYRP